MHGFSSILKKQFLSTFWIFEICTYKSKNNSNILIGQRHEPNSISGCFQINLDAFTHSWLQFIRNLKIQQTLERKTFRIKKLFTITQNLRRFFYLANYHDIEWNFLFCLDNAEKTFKFHFLLNELIPPKRFFYSFLWGFWICLTCTNYIFFFFSQGTGFFPFQNIWKLYKFRSIKYRLIKLKVPITPKITVEHTFGAFE